MISTKPRTRYGASLPVEVRRQRQETPLPLAQCHQAVMTRRGASPPLTHSVVLGTIQLGWRDNMVGILFGKILSCAPRGRCGRLGPG
jgi:hypothetical protein